MALGGAVSAPCCAVAYAVWYAVEVACSGWMVVGEAQYVRPDMVRYWELYRAPYSPNETPRQEGRRADEGKAKEWWVMGVMLRGSFKSQ